MDSFFVHNVKKEDLILRLFYPRFGFVSASRHGLDCQWDGVPDEAFMVLILDEAR